MFYSICPTIPQLILKGIGKAVCDGYYAKCEEKGTDKDAAMSCVALDNMSVYA